MTMNWQWNDHIDIGNLDIPGRHQSVVQWKFYYLVLYQVSYSQHISDVVNQIEISNQLFVKSLMCELIK